MGKTPSIKWKFIYKCNKNCSQRLYFFIGIAKILFLILTVVIAYEIVYLLLLFSCRNSAEVLLIFSRLNEIKYIYFLNLVYLGVALGLQVLHSHFARMCLLKHFSNFFKISFLKILLPKNLIQFSCDK